MLPAEAQTIDHRHPSIWHRAPGKKKEKLSDLVFCFCFPDPRLCLCPLFGVVMTNGGGGAAAVQHLCGVRALFP